jgi:tRNA modification GTPase
MSNGWFQSHRLNYGYIIDPENRRVVDEVLLSIMKAPRSYTKEDIVEINSHGGRAAVNAILELVLKQGSRLAEPGEFTKRAFLNGRIDLTQAEAVIDIIHACSKKALQMAASQIDGKLRRQVVSIRESLIEVLTRVEAAIDFPDDIEDIFDPASTVQELEAGVIDPLRALIQFHIEGNVFRDGLKVVVVGRPNVGKSSLLNCLAQKERAIVTEFPGTTRDTIEETLTINGVPIIIADTAGLHDTDDPIETIGIEKTIENVDASDMVLFMVEANCPLTSEDKEIFKTIQSKASIIVINKIDLVDGENMVELPDSWRLRNRVQISALYDRGIDRLRQKIIETAFDTDPIGIETTIVPNLRHKLLLEDSLKSTEIVINELTNEIPMELMTIHLQDAINSLGAIIGTTLKLDVLDQIFRQFCIGK